jgi:hypothetical protein
VHAPEHFVDEASPSTNVWYPSAHLPAVQSAILGPVQVVQEATEASEVNAWQAAVHQQLQVSPPLDTDEASATKRAPEHFVDEASPSTNV